MKKEISINLEEESYKQIKNIITWKNTRNLLTGEKGNQEYTVNDFIKGASLSKLEEITYIISLPQGNENIQQRMNNNFKEIAKERGVKQSSISSALGINKSTLSLIFNNEIQPRSDIFFKIWVILGSPPIHKCIYFKD